ncbi:hypothetical protein INR49_001490 [Caranx melampygus]|nr:hypothetical protein INR49_001490 [Caranx melampygus]
MNTRMFELHYGAEFRSQACGGDGDHIHRVVPSISELGASDSELGGGDVKTPPILFRDFCELFERFCREEEEDEPVVPCGLQCMSVHVINQQPVHIIPGSPLVLKAWIGRGPLENISMVTWEREPETGVSPTRVTLATCQAGSSECVGMRPNVKANMDQQEATLQINRYSKMDDGGVYIVTVTDHTGAKTPAQCIVREYEAVHHVSVSINVSHSLLVCGESWGTDPRFNWLHERVAITQTVGRVSDDGTTLIVTMTPMCGHFTCTVSNKVSHGSATYTAAPCVPEGRGTTAAVVCLVLLLLFGGVLAFLLWWYSLDPLVLLLDRREAEGDWRDRDRNLLAMCLNGSGRGKPPGGRSRLAQGWKLSGYSAQLDEQLPHHGGKVLDDLLPGPLDPHSGTVPAGVGVHTAYHLEDRHRGEDHM